MRELEAAGIRVLAMDVTEEASMVAGMEAIIAAEGRIDILINNAGFGSYGAMEEVPIADARYQLEVNVFGAARLIQLVLPHMRQRGWGRIINISSIGGKVSQKSFGHRLSDPMVIARIVLKAIRARKPRTRYAAGFMAGPILTMRKLLPDRMMDKLLAGQLQ
jgi:NAD(P)-dependent dehydrogenase (short-subunit alcohol dehydrogenase family)